MIKFPCKCGHGFELADDQAGGMIQCPRCGLLADVPTLGDLANIHDDGTFKLHDRSAIRDPHSLADLAAFSPHTHDSHGREKDLRPTKDSVAAIGEPIEDASPSLPRYDPHTGELLRPIEFRDPAEDTLIPVDVEAALPVKAIPVQPVASVRPISYASGSTSKQVTPLSLMLELFMPANIVVLAFAYIFYILAGLFGTMLAVEAFFFRVSLQVLNIPIWFILAYYGCVIEEMGPEASPELPRPLRHFAITEDIFNPMVSVISAGLICYYPLIIVAAPRIEMDEHLRVVLVLALQLAGSFFMPAVLLTTVTSGSLSNLRPDRVLGVVRSCGGDYLLSVGVFLLALVSAMFYLIAPSSAPIAPNRVIEFLHKPAVVLGVLGVSVYLAHFFCWHLGMMYRAHHEDFPWVLQRHVSTRSRHL